MDFDEATKSAVEKRKSCALAQVQHGDVLMMRTYGK